MVKDSGLSLLWRGLDPWLGNFHMQKKKKKKKKKRKEIKALDFHDKFAPVVAVQCMYLW